MKNTNKRRAYNSGGKKEREKVEKQILEYYFNNPFNNGFDEIEEKFNINKRAIQLILSKEFDRRFAIAESCRNN